MSLRYLLEHTDYQPPYATIRRDHPVDVAGPVFHFSRLKLLEGMDRLPDTDQGFALVHALPVDPVGEQDTPPDRNEQRPLLWHTIHDFQTNADGLVMRAGAEWEQFTTVSVAGWAETLTQRVHRAVNVEEVRVMLYDAVGVAFSVYQLAQEQAGAVPLHVVLSLHHVQNEGVFSHGGIMGVEDGEIDRAPLVLQYTVTEPDQRADQALRPLVDRLWQAGGLPEGRDYNDDGEWDHWTDNFPA